MVEEDQSPKGEPVPAGSNPLPDENVLIARKILDLETSQVQLARESLRVARVSLWIGVLALAAALIIVVQTVIKPVQQIQSTVKQVQEDVLAQRFLITVPRDGDEVGASLVVMGSTPFADRNLYVIVKSVSTGTDYVQPVPMETHDKTLWSGLAQIGSATVGPGTTYVIMCIATKQQLSEGPIGRLPEDAVFSNAVRVKRI